MNCKTAISAVIALSMATGPFAFAQGYGDRDERGGNEGRQPQRHAAMENRHDNRDFGRSHNEERSRGGGVGPNHEYHRGDYVLFAIATGVIARLLLSH
jgi:Ni/Co efflux regulator RcnB